MPIPYPATVLPITDKEYCYPPCATCGAWSLRVKVQESEEAPTGFLAWGVCESCGIEQWQEVD